VTSACGRPCSIQGGKSEALLTAPQGFTTGSEMTLFAPPDLGEIDAELRLEYERGQEGHRHFDSLRKQLLRFPAAFRAADGMYDRIMEEGRLDRNLKEQIFVTCSGVRGCGYGAAAHGRWLTANTDITEDEIDALVRGDALPGADDHAKTVLAFSRKVAAAPYKTVPADIEALRTVGLDERDVVEVMTVISLSGWMNGYAQALGLRAHD